MDKVGQKGQSWTKLDKMDKTDKSDKLDKTDKLDNTDQLDKNIPKNDRNLTKGRRRKYRSIEARHFVARA